MLRTVTFKVEEELLERLDRLKIRLGCDRSTLIRTAIKMLIDEAEQRNAATLEELRDPAKPVRRKDDGGDSFKVQSRRFIKFW